MGHDDPFFAVALWLSSQLGVTPATIIGFLPVFVLLCNVVGRLIPDDRTGLLGLVRKVSKVFGLYLSNRVASGVTVNDATRIVLDKVGVPLPASDLQTTQERVEEVTNKPLFPGYKTQARDETGRFLPKNRDA